MGYKHSLFFCLIFLFMAQELSAKVRFLTFQFNRPEFLELQLKLLEKFVEDDYEVIVFDDAIYPSLEEAFRNICEENKIQYVRFQPEWHKSDPLNEYVYQVFQDPNLETFFVFGPNREVTIEGISRHSSIRHNHVIQYALDHFGYDHDDIVVILDHDLFPIKSVSIRELLKKEPLIGIKIDSDHPYIWVPFVAFSPKRLPDVKELKFHCDRINGYFHDTGAHTYYYLKNHPEVSYTTYPRVLDRTFYHLPAEALKASGFFQEEIDLIKDMPWSGCIEFYVDYHFLHYGVGSADFHPIKQAGVLKYLEKILKR